MKAIGTHNFQSIWVKWFNLSKFDIVTSTPLDLLTIIMKLNKAKRSILELKEENPEANMWVKLFYERSDKKRKYFYTNDIQMQTRQNGAEESGLTNQHRKLAQIKEKLLELRRATKGICRPARKYIEVHGDTFEIL